MSDCFNAQIIRRLTAIRLDECGRIPLPEANPTPALKGLERAVQTVSRSRQVDPAPENVTRLVNGGTCTKPRGTPTDRGWQYTLAFCGANPMMEVITGYKTLDLDGSTVVGFEDRELTGTTNVMLEIIFEPLGDAACEPGADPKCQALLVPLLESWIKSGDEAYNGEATPDLTMTASTRINRRLFDNFPTVGDLPDYLSHWAPKYDAVKTGRAWSYSRFIDCPTVSTTSDFCALVAVDSGS